MAQTIVVLADGETWTMAHRCEILVITDQACNDLADGLISCADLEPLAELELMDRAGLTLY